MLRFRGVRWWVLLSLLGGCSFDSSVDGAGTEDASGDADGPTGPASSSGPVDPVTVGDGTMTGDSGTGPTTTADAESTSSGSPEADESSSSSGTGPGEPLHDRGLVVRYFLDEAAEGTDEFNVDDASPDDPLDLPLFVATGQPVYFEEGSNRGLEWSSHSNAGAAMTNIDGTKVQTALDGSSEGTIEVVVDVHALPRGTLSGRFIWIGDGQMAGSFGLTANANTGVWFRLNDVTPLMWPVDLAGMGRVVIHVVFDANAEMANQVVLYLDGEPEMGVASLLAETPITLSPDDELVLGNTSDQTKSFDGRLYYAALYNTALSAEDVADNAARLLLDDDR